MSVVNVVCCQVVMSVTDRSLVQRSSVDCGVPECDRESSIIRKPGPLGTVVSSVKQDRRCTYTVTLRRVRAIIFAAEKQWEFIHYEWVFVTEVLSVKCAILSTVASRALLYFPILSHKRQGFLEKKIIEHKCLIWFSLQLVSETFIILRRTEQDMIKKVFFSSFKIPVILVQF
jgi:hypothetical protein